MVALATARALPAQVAPNRSAVYLFPSDVQDTRALWVNPAALAILREASVGFDVTVGNPGALGRLEQFTLGLNSRGLSFGYQRDIFDNGVRGNTYGSGSRARHTASPRARPRLSIAARPASWDGNSASPTCPSRCSASPRSS